MKEQEAGWLIAELRAAFPRANFPTETIHVYVSYMLDLDYERARATIRELISTEEFLPSIAKIRLHTISRDSGLPGEYEAWEMVTRRWGHASGSGDKTVELPLDVKRALEVAGIDPYRFWTSDDRQWLRKMFIESYAEIRNRIITAENRGIARGALDRLEATGVREVDAVHALEEATGADSGRTEFLDDRSLEGGGDD